MHLRAKSQAHNAKIIVSPLTGIDTDREMLSSAKLLQLEDVA
jgi:hypothetical protein